MAVIYYHWCIPAMALKTIIEKQPGACAFDAESIYLDHLETLLELKENSQRLFTKALDNPLAGPKFAELMNHHTAHTEGKIMDKVIEFFNALFPGERKIALDLAKGAIGGMEEKLRSFCKDQLPGGPYHTETLKEKYGMDVYNKLRLACPINPSNDPIEGSHAMAKRQMILGPSSRNDTVATVQQVKLARNQGLHERVSADEHKIIAKAARETQRQQERVTKNDHKNALATKKDGRAAEESPTEGREAAAER